MSTLIQKLGGKAKHKKTTCTLLLLHMQICVNLITCRDGPVLGCTHVQKECDSFSLARDQLPAPDLIKFSHKNSPISNSQGKGRCFTQKLPLCIQH